MNLTQLSIDFTITMRSSILYSGYYRLQKDTRQILSFREGALYEKREKRAFNNLEDLWEILNSQVSETALPKQGEILPPGIGGGKTPFGK